MVLVTNEEIKKGKYIPNDIIHINGNVINTGYYDKVIYKENELFLISDKEVFNYKYEDIINYKLVENDRVENLQNNISLKLKYYGRL